MKSTTKRGIKMTMSYQGLRQTYLNIISDILVPKYTHRKQMGQNIQKHAAIWS